MALSDVASSYAPYGMLVGDPPTEKYCASVIDTLTSLSVSGNGFFNPDPLLEQMRILRTVRDEQQQLLQEFQVMTDPSLHGAIARDCMLQSNRFLSHTPLCEFWAQQHPTVTVFWRSLMKFNMLTDLWDKWIFIKGASVWTDVTPEIIMLFFQDPLVLVKHSLWVESQAIPVSVSLWTTLSNTFHCTTIADGSVWGPAIPIHDSPDS